MSKVKLGIVKAELSKRIHKIFNKIKGKWLSLLKWLNDKNNQPIVSWLSAIVSLLGIFLAFLSFRSTLEISTKQLEHSEGLYELQNRPVLLIENAGWYPMKVLSGDVGIRIRMRVSNYGKTPTNEARVIKDIMLRIKTDTLTRFSAFYEDVNKISEQLDGDKEKRLVEEYIPYRKKPFNDLSRYILERKGEVTKGDIIRHFSQDYKEKGYEFMPYDDLSYADYLIIPPGDITLETGRSISIPGFENEMLKYGGDILLFYYAIEYTGPLRIKKYVTHYFGCYDSLQGLRYRDKEGKYLFTYQKSFTDESEILKGEQKSTSK